MVNVAKNTSPMDPMGMAMTSSGIRSQIPSSSEDLFGKFLGFPLLDLEFDCLAQFYCKKTAPQSDCFF